MKKHGGSKTYVMLALLAVLLISLGYLSVQGVREGMEMAKATASAPPASAPPASAPPASAPPGVKAAMAAMAAKKPAKGPMA